MENASENLTIGAFAKAAGVNVETIRFYQLKGLLPQPERPYGRIRRYGQAYVARVKFVKSAQRLGFSLDEVGQLHFNPAHAVPYFDCRVAGVWCAHDPFSDW